MTESKSMFAKRIKKPIWWVCKYCKRGIIPINDRGFVLIEQAKQSLAKKRHPGRPKIRGRNKIVRVGVYVRRHQKPIIREVARELRNSN